jgi:hypothetical protein
MKVQHTALALAMSLAGTLGATFIAAAPANAAQPVVHACLGQSLSALAVQSPSLPPGSFGQGVVGFAQAPGYPSGLGQGIHDLQAGNIPDSLVPNTCNG